MKMDTMCLADLDYALDRAAISRLQEVVTAPGPPSWCRIAEAEYVIKAVRRHHRNLDRIRAFISSCPEEMEREAQL